VLVYEDNGDVFALDSETIECGFDCAILGLAIDN
jgi:hypothetical protein